MSPAGGERIERKASPKIHHGHDRPTVGFQYIAPPAPKMPANQADGSDDRDASNQEVSNSPSHFTLAHLTTIFAARHLHVRYPADLIHSKNPPTVARLVCIL
jgi:hypothetical protein